MNTNAAWVWVLEIATLFSAIICLIPAYNMWHKIGILFICVAATTVARGGLIQAANSPLLYLSSAIAILAACLGVQRRKEEQIASQGTQPQSLARTIPQHGSVKAIKDGDSHYYLNWYHKFGTPPKGYGLYQSHIECMSRGELFPDDLWLQKELGSQLVEWVANAVDKIGEHSPGKVNGMEKIHTISRMYWVALFAIEDIISFSDTELKSRALSIRDRTKTYIQVRNLKS